MDHGRLSSQLWQTLEREKRDVRSASKPDFEDSPADLSDWEKVTDLCASCLADQSHQKNLAGALHQYHLLVRKYAGPEAVQNDVDQIAASSLTVLHGCAQRIVGKRERDDLRKVFQTSTDPESFSQAAVPLIKRLFDLILEDGWKELGASLKKESVLPVPTDDIISDLQNVFLSDLDAVDTLPSPTVDVFKSDDATIACLRKHFAAEPASQPAESEYISEFIESQDRVQTVLVHSKNAGNTSGLDLVRAVFKAQYVQPENSGFPVEDLIREAEAILLNPGADESLQEDLANLLGFENLDLVSSLIQNRDAVKRQREKSQKPHNSGRMHKGVDPQVSVKKFHRNGIENVPKYSRDGWEQAPGAFESDEEFARRLQEQEMGPGDDRQVYQAPKFPNVFDQLAEVKQSVAYISNQKIQLPDHTMKNWKTHDELTVPAPSKVSIPVDRLPPIRRVADSDEVIQQLFKGYDTLNQIQSAVYQTAYTTNENMLVCAPTGAGKTNTAMLAIAREISQNLQNGVLEKNFKIVYVAPMKALASEMVRTFSERLSHYKLRVEEVTGDTQVSAFELEKTHMIITTPEKWDVITRKSIGDDKLVSQVSLMIIDEIHLLNDDRGPVIESLVARTIRMIEEKQKMVRLVGLSATLPTYVDVADFLHVNKELGLFFFDGRFRPVPLEQTFIGMKTPPGPRNEKPMYDVMYMHLMNNIRAGHQVLVFVHARNQTHKVANTIREMATECGDLEFFRPNEDEESYDNKNVVSSMVVKRMQDFAQKTTNRELKNLVPDGIGVHHAGMIRPDRNLVEKLFKDGGIRVLVCTATLAWGVNLPAHCAIIFGTQLYKPEKGAYEDIDLLDVQQIFGRAGRPQFDKSGHGIIITTHASMPKFVKMLTSSEDIESQMPDHLLEHLNAEIVLHNISSVHEATEWLKSTYWYRRVEKKPLLYGLDQGKLRSDPSFKQRWFEKKVFDAARELDKARLVRFVEVDGFLHPTQMGNIASWFYIDVKTMEIFSDPETGLREHMQEYEILAMVCQASEFSQIKVRNEELEELDEFKDLQRLPPGKDDVDDAAGKVNVLIQSYISRCQPKTHSLSSDLYYCQQNSTRIIRAVFQMAMYKNWSDLADNALNLCLFVENRIWMDEHPLRQFNVDLPAAVYRHLEGKKLDMVKLKDLREDEIGALVQNKASGRRIKEYADMYPIVELEAIAKPLGNAVIQICIKITPNFTWNDKFLGSKRVLNFWIWVEDPVSKITLHTQEYALQKVKVLKQAVDELEFVIPALNANDIQLHLRSDKFLHSRHLIQIRIKGVKLPKYVSQNTELLNLQPLPVKALNDPGLQNLFPFEYFNAMQTQVFHTLMHTDLNVLLGAPTGSGKTIAAEFALFRAMNITKCKVVYIAPLKALVRERVADWTGRFQNQFGWNVVELTGDTAPDIRAVNAAQIIITTPEKWDGISRSWQHRSYVQDVRLLIFDEIHMLGEDRGPVIEVIVSRTNFIASSTGAKVRIVGLSTALASAHDVGDWLGIRQAGLFNFPSSVRPVPLEVHISGYPGKHYCPRMQLMNKPAYQEIRKHSQGKPVLVFVSSRRQTRLTGFALLSYASIDLDRGREWMRMTDAELNEVNAIVQDPELKQLIMYGIGIHHAGLHARDREQVELLFLSGKILILIATATLAWGVNFPAHLVVIKGTEYYDGKTKQYVRMPLTDVLQMAGRAGRPQFDKSGVAVILCHEPLKNYYLKFLHNPLPVESQMQEVVADHINAEIVAGTLTSFSGAMDYMKWTYLYRRLLANPDYYGVVRPSAISNPEVAAVVSEDDPVLQEDVRKHVSGLILNCLTDLSNSGCVEYYQSEERKKRVTDNEIQDFILMPTYLGTISSYYYLKHGTMRLMSDRLTKAAKLSEILQLLCDAKEFEQMPVRHNEDAENGLLSKQVPLPVEQSRLDSPHAKVFLLLQVYFSRNQVALPSADYATDLKSVMDQVLRVLQGMIDVSAQKGLLATTLRIMQLSQMLIQGEWIGVDPFHTLPHADSLLVEALRRLAPTLPGLASFVEGPTRNNMARLKGVLSNLFPNGRGADEKVLQAVITLPLIEVSLRLSRNNEEDETAEKSAAKVIRIGSDRRTWIPVECSASYMIEVHCARTRPRRVPGRKVATSRFQRPKDENWWFVLGEVESGELLAMKRVGFISRTFSSSLLLTTSPDPGRKILYFYFVSDSYLGMDQQIAIQLDVTRA